MSRSFLQSYEWENFQKLVGRKTWRVDDILIMRHDLPAGVNYLYCPRPELVTSNWLLTAENIAREENSVFLKIDPADQLPVTSSQLSDASSIQPRKTVILDLRKSEEELLRAMHEKTRYNIRLAEKRGVTCRVEDARGQNFERFWVLLDETARRDRFHTHERGYYQKLLAARSSDFTNELFFAGYRGVILAAAVVNFYKPGRTATYLHGASLRERKEVMAPYLLHWRIVQEAKKRGFNGYDLWGIDDNKWPGLTRFKIGFGGTTIEYPHSVDVIYRSLVYKLYKFIRRIRNS